MKLQNERGIIEKLQIISTKQNILYSPQLQESAGISAIIFALAGMGGAAAQTAANSESGADDVDIYSFELNNTSYAGVTRKATFKNGDAVEIVYDYRDQGREVLGIRRPSTRSIWLYPYMSCGLIAAIIRGLKYWVIFNAIGILGILTIFYFTWTAPLSSDLIQIVVFTSLFVTGLAFSWMIPRLLGFSRAASEIFSSMGYENPKMVDLHKTSKAYRKKNNITWTIKNNTELWY